VGAATAAAWGEGGGADNGRARHHGQAAHAVLRHGTLLRLGAGGALRQHHHHDRHRVRLRMRHQLRPQDPACVPGSPSLQRHGRGHHLRRRHQEPQGGQGP
jgi:hypothetical protein